MTPPRTPSPQTTEGLGATPLTDLPARIVVGKNGAYWRDYGDSYSMCPVSTDNDPVMPVAIYVRVENPPSATDDEPTTANGRDLLRHAVQYNPADADRRITAAKIIAVENEARVAAARLSVPSEALAETLQANPMLRRFVQWNPSLYGALADEVLAALPNREDAPAWTEADIPVPDLEPWEAPVVREDAPSREGLDGWDGLISPGTIEDVAAAMHRARITGCAFSGGKQTCSPRDHIEDARAYLRERRAALAATPPGDREELHASRCRCRLTPACLPHGWAGTTDSDWNVCADHEHHWRGPDPAVEEAAVATAEAAAGEEES